MRIVTNPGSNLSAAAVRHYDLFLTPQQIVVDGVQHNTRDGIDLATVDAWVKTAREHPYVLGTSAAEYADVFRHVAEKDRKILAVMTSRKIIGSYTAAVAASRALARLHGYGDVHVAVVDTKVTDVGAGLATLLAGEAVRAALPLQSVIEVLEAFAEQGRFLFVPETLDYLVKGGRASFVKAAIANFLDRVPLIAMEDGDLRSIGTLSRSEDATATLVERLVSEFGEGRRVWCAIAHGNAPDRARGLAFAVERSFKVEYMKVRPFHASIYLHAGPGSVGVYVCPVDRLPWNPTAPPFLED
jgi:DegV family protein with EDD domain